MHAHGRFGEEFTFSNPPLSKSATEERFQQQNLGAAFQKSTTVTPLNTLTAFTEKDLLRHLDKSERTGETH